MMIMFFREKCGSDTDGGGCFDRKMSYVSIQNVVKIDDVYKTNSLI